MSKIKIAVIGSGWVTENRHIPAIIKSNRFEITAIVGRQKEKLDRLAKKFRIPKIFLGNAEENLSWLETCDAVSIGVSPMNHYRVVMFALNNGKNVLVEKPLTFSSEESESIRNKVLSSGLSFVIMHNFQFSESIRKMEKDIATSEFGEITGLFAYQLSNPKRRLPVWYEMLPWGLFFDESPHLLYLLKHFAGNLELINAIKYVASNNRSTPSCVSVNFLTKKKVPAVLYANYDSSLSEWYFVLHGKNKTGVVDIFRDIYTSFDNDKSHAPNDILRTSFSGIKANILGTMNSGIKVLRNDYLCGNDLVFTSFADSIQYKKIPKNISIEDAVSINNLQFEIMNTAKEVYL